MMIFSRADLITLAKQEPSHAVSLYMPLHPKNGERQQDALRLRNLLKEAEQKLTANGATNFERDALLDQAHAFLEAMSLEDSSAKGLVLFSAPPFFAVYPCPLSFSDRVMVDQHLYIKPLLPLLIETGAFYVLTLSENRVRLLHGTREGLSEITVPEMAQSLKQALASEQVEKQHQVRTIGLRAGTGARMGLFYGRGEGTDDEKDRLTRFLTMISHRVDQALRAEHAPLIAAGVESLVSIYRAVNEYVGLTEEFVPGNPERWSGEALHERAWSIAQLKFKAPLEQALKRYEQLGGTPRASRALRRIMPAALQGRIETLFLEAEQDRWGYLHPETGALSLHNEHESNDQELLNLAAIRTLRADGDVFVLDAQAMPVTAAAAAILRY